ncbi:MAG: hypothetical protein ACYCYP_09590 [Leptospirales bacterium]
MRGRPGGKTAFRSLLAVLETLCRNVIRPEGDEGSGFSMLTRSPPQQGKAFSLLGSSRTCSQSLQVQNTARGSSLPRFASAIRAGSSTIPPQLPSRLLGRETLPPGLRTGGKPIGATCHSVTAELDDGPIIDQDMIRVGHGASPGKMARLGGNIEKMVLARGIRYHTEDRILIHGRRTIVFS